MRIRWYAPAVVVLLLIVAGGTVLGASQWGVYQGYPVVGVVVDGEPVICDVPAVNFNGRTMVPLRFVSEALGATVTWDDASWTAAVHSQPSEEPDRLAKLEQLLALWRPEGSGVEVAPEAVAAGDRTVSIQGWNVDLGYDRCAIAIVPEDFYETLDRNPIPKGINSFTSSTSVIEYHYPLIHGITVRFADSIVPFVVGEVDVFNGCFLSQEPLSFTRTGRCELWLVPPVSVLSSPDLGAYKVAARMAALEVATSPRFLLLSSQIEEGWSAPTWASGPSEQWRFPFYNFSYRGYGFQTIGPVSICVYPEGQPAQKLTIATEACEHGQFESSVWPGGWNSALRPGRYVVEARQDCVGAASAVLTVVPKMPIQVTAELVQSPSGGSDLHVTGSGFWPASPVYVHLPYLSEQHWQISYAGALGTPTAAGILDLTIEDVSKWGRLTGLVGIEQIGRTQVECTIRGY